MVNVIVKRIHEALAHQRRVQALICRGHVEKDARAVLSGMPARVDERDGTVTLRAVEASGQDVCLDLLRRKIRHPRASRAKTDGSESESL